MSTRALALAAVLLAAQAAAAEQVRLLLSIGSNYGRPDDPVLQFAEEDASRLRDLFVDLGSVDSSRALVLRRPSAMQVRERFAEIAGRVSELHAQHKAVALVVFVSAHGKAGVLHLSGSMLPIEGLRELARATQADLKLLLVDACESGIAPRPKGARKGPSYALSFQPPAVKGDVFISSSGAHEPAQEWDVLGGSLFTHHLLTALRGDADFDGDGRVTLMEAYGYATRRTVAESLDTGQHPEFDVGLTGAGDLVLTELHKSRAQVVLSERLEGRFVLVSLPKPNLLAELTKQRGRPLKLAVPPGRYLLKQTTGFRVSLQEIELPYGGSAAVDGSEFVVRDYSEVAMKGSGPEFHPHAMRLSAALFTSPLSGTSRRWGAGASYRLALGSWWSSLGASAGRASYRGMGLRTDEWRLAGRLGGGYRLWAGPLVVMPAVGLEAANVRQSYLRDDEAAIRRSYPALPTRSVWGFAFGPQLWVEAPLPGPLFASVGALGWVRELPSEEQPSWTLGAEAEVCLGVRW